MFNAKLLLIHATLFVTQHSFTCSKQSY